MGKDEIVHSLDGPILGPVFAPIILPLLDAETAAQFSNCSSTLYHQVKKASCWKDKLFALGCSKIEIEKLIENKVITNYKILYANILKIPANDIPLLKAWELCCLSSEFNAIQWAMAHENLTKDTRNDKNWDALRYAIITDSVDLVMYFLKEFNLSRNLKNNFNEKIIHLAAFYNSMAVLIHLHKVLRVSPYSVARYDANILQYAAWGGAIDALNYLRHSLNISIHKTDHDGSTLFHYAAWSGSIKMILFALDELQFSLGEADPNGMNALQFAAWSGSYDAICLIRYLADKQDLPLTPLTRDHFNDDAHWYASRSPNPDQAEEALELPMVDLIAYVEDLLASKPIVQNEEKEESLTANRGIKF